MIAYGHTVTSNQTDYITRAEDAQAKFSIAATPNTYLVDSLPFCMRNLLVFTTAAYLLHLFPRQ